MFVVSKIFKISIFSKVALNVTFYSSSVMVSAKILSSRTVYINNIIRNMSRAANQHI